MSFSRPLAEAASLGPFRMEKAREDVCHQADAAPSTAVVFVYSFCLKAKGSSVARYESKQVLTWIKSMHQGRMFVMGVFLPPFSSQGILKFRGGTPAVVVLYNSTLVAMASTLVNLHCKSLGR